MSEMGSSLNRILGPLRRYYGHSPRFERLVNRAIWSLTTPWFQIGSAPEKIRLLENVRPFTLVHGWGLSKIYELCREIERRRIPGAFVECGVWKGGCAGVMAHWAARTTPRRSLWLFDSFEGLPEPTPEDGEKLDGVGPDQRTGTLEPIGKYVSCLEDVQKVLFSVLHLNSDNIFIEKGWFQSTLPAARSRVGPIALLRLDADLYQSTKCCLENLYDNVAAGGLVIVDDYLGWPGCRQAVDEFLVGRGENVRFRQVDPLDMNSEFSAVYFTKPGVPNP